MAGFDRYELGGFYDELFDGEGRPRTGAEPLIDLLARLAGR